MMVGAYAKVAGIVLLLVGVGDLVFDIQGVAPPEDVMYLTTGGIFAYVGFGQPRDQDGTRSIVGGIGLLYLLVGVFVLVAVFLFGLTNLEGTSDVDDILHVAFGLLCVVVAGLSR